MGYINQTRFLQKLHEAHGGKQIHIMKMLRTISLEFWLRDLAARGLLDSETRLVIATDRERIKAVSQRRFPTLC
jgi:hypothetical protein